MEPGVAYEPSTNIGKRMLWVGLAAGSAAHYATTWPTRPSTSSSAGIAEFCGITDATVHLVYDTLAEPQLAAVDEALSSTTIAA